MVQNNDNGRFAKDFIRCLTLALIIVFYLLSLTSCSVFKSLKKDTRTVTSDTTNVHKETDKINSVDTSKSKSTYSKETITFYPTRDTNIFNINIPRSTVNNPYPVYITKETGTNETQNYNYETREKQIIDSMKIANLEMQLSVKSESKVKAGPSFLEWILIIGLGLLLIKNFMPNITKIFSK